MSIRIVIADDHALIRGGLRGLLEGLAGVEIAGEASDGLEALRLVGELEPDILMTDIAMPGLDGLGLTARVSRDHPKSRVIILSMHSEQAYADRAIRSGAAGYLVKDSDIHEISLAIKAVARGESYLSPAVSRHIVAEYARLAEARGGEPPGGLSPRQLEVLKLIVLGHTTKAIARKLNISVKTADTHRVQLMDRLGIHDIAGLVRYAIRNGLTDEQA